MGIVIDSSVLIRLERDRKLLDHFDLNEDLFISVITASELLHGVYRALDLGIKQRRSAFVEEIIRRIPSLDIDLRVSRAHSLLWSELTREGNMIGLHDSWIAATCIAFGYSVVTHNQKEFKRVPGLKVIELS